jgi:hypothetical protein
MLAIQESGFHIKLLEYETIRSDDKQEEAQGIEIYYGDNRLLLILSLNLGKSLCH